MSMNHIAITVLTDGSVQVDGPGADELLADLNRYFDLFGITSAKDKVAEIARLAPTAQRMTAQ